MIISSILLYVDPGSGSYLVQALIAAALGAWFWIKSYWWKIKSYFKKDKKEESGTDDEHPQPL